MIASEPAPHSLTERQLATVEQSYPLDEREENARGLLENVDSTPGEQKLSSDSSSCDKALQHALLYAEKFGLRVFPCHSVHDGECTCQRPNCRDQGKHPRTTHGFKDATTDPKVIRDWWTRWPDANIGIATGEGLVVIDVDPRNGGDQSLAELEAEFGELPRSWHVSTGGGGRHIYLSIPAGIRIKKRQNWRNGIDIQGVGAYVIAPPSNHIKDGDYQWLQLQLPSPGAMQPELLQALAQVPHKQNTDRPSTASSRKQIDNNNYSVLSVSSWSSQLARLVEAAIDVATVSSPGTRNKRLVALARRLKCLPELQDKDAEDCQPIVREWFRRSLPNMRTKEWEKSWVEWLKIWVWADKDRCQDGLEIIWEIAQSRPHPQVAKKYPSRQLRMLVTLCSAMQERAADQHGVWYLSCRKAGALLGIGHKTAAMWLKTLVKDGVLHKAKRHVKGSLNAQRYQYLGDSPQEKKLTQPEAMAPVVNDAALRTEQTPSTPPMK